MPKKIENVKLGACNIYFAGKDLGYTSGGVEVQIETDTQQITVDQQGNTVMSEIIQGRNVKITAPLAETILDNLVALLPGASISTNGEQLTITTGMGENLLDYAQELKLVPINESDYTVVVPKAATAGNFSMAYRHDEMRVFETEFTGYPDDGVVAYIQKTSIPDVVIGTFGITSDNAAPVDGDTVTLTATLGNVDPSTNTESLYQWYRDGVAMIGEKTATLAINYVSALESGKIYKCVAKVKADGYKTATKDATITMP